MRYLLTVVLAGSVALVSACATHPREPASDQAPIVVSVKQQGLSYPPGTRYAFVPAASLVVSDERMGGAPMDRMFREALQKVMEKKGYPQAMTPSQAGLLVGYVMALESALDDLTINRLYGLNPGLVPTGPTDPRYEKGTLIVDIIDPVQGASVWRSAVQGMADFEVSQSERETRLGRAAELLLQEFPAAGK